MVFAFDDHGRQQEVRRIADRVKALEDALRGMRNYYRQHMISGTLYKHVEDALGEPNAEVWDGDDGVGTREKTSTPFPAPSCYRSSELPMNSNHTNE